MPQKHQNTKDHKENLGLQNNLWVVTVKLAIRNLKLEIGESTPDRNKSKFPISNKNHKRFGPFSLLCKPICSNYLPVPKLPSEGL